MNIVNDLACTFTKRRKDGRKEFVAAMGEFGLVRSYLDEPVKRSLFVSLVGGFPMLKDPAWPQLEVTIEGSIEHYSIVMSEDERFIMAFVGTSECSVYVTIEPKQTRHFIIDGEAQSLRGSLIRLLEHNLCKGERMFQQTVSFYPRLFYKLFTLFGSAPALYRVSPVHLKGDILRGKVYIYPEEPSRNAISINGWVYNFDLDKFPLHALHEGHRLERLELMKGRRRERVTRYFEGEREKAGKLHGHPSHERG